MKYKKIFSLIALPLVVSCGQQDQKSQTEVADIIDPVGELAEIKITVPEEFNDINRKKYMPSFKGVEIGVQEKDGTVKRWQKVKFDKVYKFKPGHICVRSMYYNKFISSRDGLKDCTTDIKVGETTVYQMGLVKTQLNKEAVQVSMGNLFYYTIKHSSDSSALLSVQDIGEEQFLLPHGAYSVGYHAMSPDGHQIPDNPYPEERKKYVVKPGLNLFKLVVPDVRCKAQYNLAGLPEVYNLYKPLDMTLERSYHKNTRKQVRSLSLSPVQTFHFLPGDNYKKLKIEGVEVDMTKCQAGKTFNFNFRLLDVNNWENEDSGYFSLYQNNTEGEVHYLYRSVPTQRAVVVPDNRSYTLEFFKRDSLGHKVKVGTKEIHTGNP